MTGVRTIFASLLPGLLLLGCGSTGTGPARDGGGDSTAPDGDAQADTPAAEDRPDGGPDDASEAGTPDAGGYTLPSFAGGFDFFLTLPPSFSPFLPLTGEEVTREPPGFHDQTSDHYFSYGFLWWLTGTPDLSTTALHDDLVLYFTGLCPSTTVTATLGDPEGASADAGSGALIARRSGTLDAATCFSLPVPSATTEVSTYQCPDHTAVLVLLSPQPSTSQTWTDLRGVRDAFVCW